MPQAAAPGADRRAGAASRLLSVIVPIYFDEDNIDAMYARLKSVLAGLSPEFDHQIVYVNDGSTDRSLPMLRRIAEGDTRVLVIDLSRNFGHQRAITAGMDYARGDLIAIIDSDLQDPPEVILEMIAKWREGFDVVYGQRARRRGESLFKRVTAKLFYRLLAHWSDVEIPLDTGDFRLMDRRVVDRLREMREESRYIRGLVAWLGFRQCALEYERQGRHAGETGYTLAKLFQLAFDGITGFSDKPLHFASKIGLGITVVSSLLIALLVLHKFFNPATIIEGWTSLVLVVLFFGGVQLITIGLLGLYVGRIYREVKRRPLYVVSGIYGAPPPAGAVPVSRVA